MVTPMILSSSELKQKFDKAIQSLEKNNGDELVSLSGLLYSLGDAKGDPLYALANFPLYNLGIAFSDFYPLIATPQLLPKDIKPDYDSVFNKARSETTQLLKELKTQFCEKDKPDYEQVAKALGKIYMHFVSLASKKASFTRTQPQMPAPPAFEEE